VGDDSDERAIERVGTVLNEKWKLERLIGIGGMAAVYAGLHRNGARAAIKILHASFARRPEVRQRFVREGYAANTVNHSGVVKVLDDDIIQGGTDDGGAFLVMELLEGQSIEDRIENGPPISEGEILAIMRAVLDVLEVAHKAGVIHRDLKPDNIFLARDPEQPEAPPKIKILDFGLARVAELGGGKTVVGLAIGTPSYMPPEQAAGRVLEIDGRSDLFALAASCFRVLAGRTVHPAEDAVAICTRMATEPAPKLRSVAPHVSAGTALVIDRALAFERNKRWRDAASMRLAVSDAISELGGVTIQIDSGMIEVSEPIDEPHSSAPAAPSPEPSAPTTTPAPKRRPSFLLRMLIVALAVVAGKLGYDRYGKALMARVGGVLNPPTEVHSVDAESATPSFIDAGLTDAHAAVVPPAHDAGHHKVHP
jgi:eukaryotic-like serine/threonine-protein kinase